MSLEIMFLRFRHTSLTHLILFVLMFFFLSTLCKYFFPSSLISSFLPPASTLNKNYDPNLE